MSCKRLKVLLVAALTAAALCLPAQGQEPPGLPEAVARAAASGVSDANVDRLLSVGYQYDLTTDEMGAFLDLLADAAREGMPVEELLGKIQEGLAKHVSPGRVRSVVADRLDTFRFVRMRAEEALARWGKPASSLTPGDIAALSGGLAAGLSRAELADLLQTVPDLPFRQIADALEMWAVFSQGGLPADSGRQIVLSGLEAGYFAQTDWRLGSEVVSALRGGAAPDTVAAAAMDVVSGQSAVQDAFARFPGEDHSQAPESSSKAQVAVATGTEAASQTADLTSSVTEAVAETSQDDQTLLALVEALDSGVVSDVSGGSGILPVTWSGTLSETSGGSGSVLVSDGSNSGSDAGNGGSASDSGNSSGGSNSGSSGSGNNSGNGSGSDSGGNSGGGNDGGSGGDGTVGGDGDGDPYAAILAGDPIVAHGVVAGFNDGDQLVLETSSEAVSVAGVGPESYWTAQSLTRPVLGDTIGVDGRLVCDDSGCTAWAFQVQVNGEWIPVRDDATAVPLFAQGGEWPDFTLLEAAPFSISGAVAALGDGTLTMTVDGKDVSVDGLPNAAELAAAGLDVTIGQGLDVRGYLVPAEDGSTQRLAFSLAVGETHLQLRDGITGAPLMAGLADLEGPPDPNAMLAQAATGSCEGMVIDTAPMHGVVLAANEGDLSVSGLGPEEFWQAKNLSTPDVGDFLTVETCTVNLEQGRGVRRIATAVESGGERVVLREAPDYTPAWCAPSSCTTNACCWTVLDSEPFVADGEVSAILPGGRLVLATSKAKLELSGLAPYRYFTAIGLPAPTLGTRMTVSGMAYDGITDTRYVVFSVTMDGVEVDLRDTSTGWPLW